MTQRLEIPGTLITDVAIREPNELATECVLLLHGYLQSGASILKRLGPALPDSALVLAPNAPFPLPRRHEDRWKLGFSWYFYDFSTDQYFIDMRVALEAALGVVDRLGSPGLPWRVIGYSQGGYLAPFVAARMTHVEQVVGIACRFLDDELPAKLPFRLDSIHGSDDETIDCALSRAAHHALIATGRAPSGEFRELPGMGHGIGEPMREALRDLTRS